MKLLHHRFFVNHKYIAKRGIAGDCDPDCIILSSSIVSWRELSEELYILVLILSVKETQGTEGSSVTLFSALSTVLLLSRNLVSVSMSKSIRLSEGLTVPEVRLATTWWTLVPGLLMISSASFLIKESFLMFRSSSCWTWPWRSLMMKLDFPELAAELTDALDLWC